MNFYQFYPSDQRSNNWLLLTEHSEQPILRVREQYKDLVCSKCKRFDEDAVFKVGFAENVKLRVKGDLFASTDDLVCFNSKTVGVLKEHGALNGLALKPLGSTGWYVVNFTLRVSGNANVYSPTRATCRQCGRHCSVTGSIQHLSEIDCPPTQRTWFTPKFDREGYAGRDIFATGDMVTILKSSGLKGGIFERLMTAEEESAFRESLSVGKAKHPSLIVRL